jgi:hypothetical protein
LLACLAIIRQIPTPYWLRYEEKPSSQANILHLGGTSSQVQCACLDHETPFTHGNYEGAVNMARLGVNRKRLLTVTNNRMWVSNEEPFSVVLWCATLAGKEPGSMNGERGVAQEFTISPETQELFGNQQLYQMSLPNAPDHVIAHSELDDTSDTIVTCGPPVRWARVIDNERETQPLERHKQSVLQKACRRIGKSSSGSKGMLARRLFESSYESYESVQELAREFDVAGKVGDETIRGRSPNWTANETARLAHVLVDPSNATALTRLVSRASRDQLDCGLRDPWSEEFQSLFNNPKFEPEVPEIAGGAVQETLDRFDPSELKHKRDAAKLKSQWASIRSKFTVAYKNWSSSGQGDVDMFPSFCEGDEVLVYVFCVFNEKPAMEQVLRLLPENARVEEGISELRSAEHPTSLRRKRQRDVSVSSQAESDLASAIRDSFVQKEGSRVSDMADAVTKLMALEKMLAEMIEGARTAEDKTRFEDRISIVRKQIDNLLGIQ